MRPQKPNIILILADDLGYGDLECYGSKVHRTPCIDQLSQEGVLFTDFYSASPQCSPSRASFMTGCYPQRVGLGRGYDFPVLLPGDPLGLHPDEITIARLLHNNGYATRIIGKWHLGDQPEFLPTEHGFDDYYGLPSSNDHHSERPEHDRTHLPKRFRDFPFPPLPLMKDTSILELNPDQTTLTERYTDKAIEFIKEHRNTPFFLYLAHMYVHTPLHPPAEYLAKSRNGPYGAEVEHLDDCTGRLVDAVIEAGLDENTVIVFTSDNGAARGAGGTNAPLRGWKNSTWEGGMRVPCIIRWPGSIDGNRECNHIVTAMDLYATIAHAAGIEILTDRATDSRDIAPLLWDQKNQWHPHSCFFYYNGDDLEAIRVGKWKLHMEPMLLYDLEADIGEQRNIIDQHPDIVQSMFMYVKKAQHELGDSRRRYVGTACRSAGWVANPQPLVTNDPDDPLIQSAYD
jgi:arylsulfatase A-like enzyme